MNLITPNHLTLWPEEGQALPGHFYVNEQFYELERRGLFTDDWFFVAPVGEVGKPGDYSSIDIAGEPLLVTHAKDGVIRVLSRVCRHRHLNVIEGRGNKNSFTCPYHSWTYKSDGILIGAPMMDQVPSFDKKKCGLPSIKTEIWNGLIFCTFAADPQPLEDQLKKLGQRLDPYRLGEWEAELVFNEAIDCNWKVVVENASESYHHIGAHKDSLEAFTPAKNVRMGETGSRFSTHHLWPVNLEPGVELSGTRETGILRIPETEASVGGTTTIFPNMIIAVSAEGALLAGVFPQAHDNTVFRLWTLRHPSMPVERYKQRAGKLSAREFLEKFNGEDLVIVQGLQKALKSRFADGGTFHTTEVGLTAFYDFIKGRVF